MEDQAGCYKSIMSPAKPSGPRDSPSTSPSPAKPPPVEAKKDHASPPASPPSGGLPSAEAYTDQPSGASENSPTMSPAGASSGSWAKIAASAPLPMPMHQQHGGGKGQAGHHHASSFEATDAGRAGHGPALLSDWVSPHQRTARA